LASSGSFNKREKEKKRQQKHEEKERRKEERKANASGGGLDSMMAYVDENGMITSTPLQTPPNARRSPWRISRWVCHAANMRR
jgi:hypothetical protein